MALGCAFIFLVVVVAWRRRMRKRRAQATAAFAQAKRLGAPRTWRWRLRRLGAVLLGQHRRPAATDEEAQALRLEKLRTAEDARHTRGVEKLGGAAYDLPSVHEPGERASLSTESLYTQVTGQPRRAPEPRQPVRNARDMLPSRFSDTTMGSHEREARAPTPAQEYARSVAQAQAQEPRGAYWVTPTSTGDSNNPFRR